MSTTVPAQSVPQRFRVFRHPLAALILGCSLITGSLAWMAETTAASATPSPLADGIYVFGESPTAHQLGTTYMVMEVAGQDVSGGFYQPASSFDCFYGEATGTYMTLTVIDSYAQEEHSLAMPLENSTVVASETSVANTWVPAGFHRLTEVTATDRQVLQTCTSR
ncbi:hypothetical protein [Leptolyngbya iicbica]|uniref:Uncharacterized protein n=2 Tax=Cyanophyceae TaxID=3028117 RepID=A0A4Q7E883_9CYAN|nr:hypothetical protein [Leptolyngbya sp. LK]RZM79007.1 hypothetical protein DYY88_09545 [Leptolyngbya sp. LK]